MKKHRSIRLFRRVNALVQVAVGILAITCLGCEADESRLGPSVATSRANIIFDAAAAQYRLDYVSPTEFGRRLWPEPSSTGYASRYESSYYRDYFYDDQYIGPDNKPRQHYHRRRRGYTQQFMSR